MNNSEQGPLVVRSGLEVPMSEFSFTFARSSGPGGQNVNKVNSKAVLRWPVEASASLPEGVKQRFLSRWRRRITKDGELLISSESSRDQGRNQADCLNRLREMIAAVAEAPKPRKKSKPTRGSKERRHKQKRMRSERKQLRQSPRSGE